MRRVWAPIVLVLLTLSSPPAGAQVFGASGSEFQVNTTTTGNQYNPAVGIDATGAFLVTWRGPDGDSTGIFGRRFFAGGSPKDPTDFRINSNTTGIVDHVGAAGHGTGGFVATWQRQDSSGDKNAFGQRYNSAGELGSVFQVNSSTPAGSPFPSVASDDSGNFVVVWLGATADGVTGQRYSSAGAPLGGEFLVNTITTSDLYTVASVGRAGTGQFVVVWERGGDIFGRRFAGSGGPQGGEFKINTVTVGLASSASVAVSTGGFVAVWQNVVTGGSNVKARLYDSAGAPQTAEFRVNTYTTGYQHHAAVGMDGGGGFVVVWESGLIVNGSGGIQAQRYTSAGAPLGTEFRVQTTNQEGNFPAIAVNGLGNFVVTYDGFDGNAVGVSGRFFCAALAGDVDNNSSIDVADVFYLINRLFAGGPPVAPGSGDVNGDGLVDVADVFYLINYLFAGGPGPACKPPPV
jgi:hypothetical protein